jgi:hypothetical protein
VLARAIDHTTKIIQDLHKTLEEMELVLELLEEAERDKLVDERELKSLQAALDRLQRQRPHGGSPPHEHRRSSGHPHPQRSHARSEPPARPEPAEARDDGSVSEPF